MHTYCRDVLGLVEQNRILGKKGRWGIEGGVVLVGPTYDVM